MALKITDFSVVIVTGGSSGIGASFIAAAIDKLCQNARIFNLSRSKPLSAEGEPIAGISHIKCDLGQRDSRKAALAELKAELSGEKGRILLINNAGFGAYGPFPEPDIDHHLDMIAVNMAAPLELVAGLLPELRKQGGAIINVASIAAYQPTPHLSTYGATKSFLRNWSLGLGEELRGSGIHVLAVCPGPTESNFFRRAGFEDSPLPDQVGHTSEQVVAMSLKALEQGKTCLVCGFKHKLLTFFSARLPLPLVTRISTFTLKRVRRID